MGTTLRPAGPLGIADPITPYGGIAMGTGTDAAMAAAGMMRVRGDLRGLFRVRNLSRATMRNIRRNLFFTLIPNALGLWKIQLYFFDDRDRRCDGRMRHCRRRGRSHGRGRSGQGSEEA